MRGPYTDLTGPRGCEVEIGSRSTNGHGVLCTSLIQPIEECSDAQVEHVCTVISRFANLNVAYIPN